MKENVKLYNKAFRLYNNGQLDESLEICEKILSDSITNYDALNLKGLIFYRKGQLTEARTVWKINADINNDKVAENYLKKSENDSELESRYINGTKALAKMETDKALTFLKQCEESDFNSVNVCTEIGKCYKFKGDMLQAQIYITKALTLDKNDKRALEVKKDLIKEGGYSDEKKKSRKVLTAATAAFIIFAAGAGVFSIYRKNTYQTAENNITYSNTENAVQQDNTEGNLNQENNVFNEENLKTALENKDFNTMYEALENITPDELTENQVKTFEDIWNSLKNEGVIYFYTEGLNSFNTKDYEKAAELFEKAYKYSEDNDLREDILFFRGNSAEQMQEKEKSKLLYKEYIDKYPSGAYAEGVLYDLALFNKDDISLSKSYAEKLMDLNPNSIYINDNIRDIIES